MAVHDKEINEAIRLQIMRERLNQAEEPRQSHCESKQGLLKISLWDRTLS
jgi:hypothetical protein